MTPSEWMSPAGIASGLRAEELERDAALANARRLNRSDYAEMVTALLYFVACAVAWEVGGWRLGACMTIGLTALWAFGIAARSLLRDTSDLLRWMGPPSCPPLWSVRSAGQQASETPT